MISGWEIEDMIADENSRIWEAMNPPETEEEEPEEEPEYNLYSAEDELKDCLDSLYEAINHAQNAADDADGHPVAARITAAFNALQSTEIWIRKLKDSITAEILEREKKESERRHAV